jgi:hypothetical protein
MSKKLKSAIVPGIFTIHVSETYYPTGLSCHLMHNLDEHALIFPNNPLGNNHTGSLQHAPL